jgi:hypothetical protein
MWDRRTHTYTHDACSHQMSHTRSRPRMASSSRAPNTSTTIRLPSRTHQHNAHATPSLTQKCICCPDVVHLIWPLVYDVAHECEQARVDDVRQRIQHAVRCACARAHESAINTTASHSVSPTSARVVDDERYRRPDRRTQHRVASTDAKHSLRTGCVTQPMRVSAVVCAPVAKGSARVRSRCTACGGHVPYATKLHHTR